ncbi:MAG: serine hydrolase domain-containing protein [Pirellulales bacterium]
MSFPKPLFHNPHALPIALVWMASTCALSAELHPPEATQDELAKASYAEEKTLEDLPTAFIDTSPDAEDGLAAGTLGIDGGEVDPILKFANEIAAGTHGEVDSLLISYRGKLLFESYFRRGRVNYPHYQMSITKSYTALAIGRAIQCGYLTMNDLERPVYEFLKELDPTRFAKGAATITLADVMTMRSGIRIPQNVQQQIRLDTAKNEGQHQVQMFFERTAPIPSAPREFKYQGIDPAITMQVLEAVVPGSAQAFLKKELLENLYISQFHWPEDISGLPKSAAGSSMRSRDMVKWGLLVRQQGQFNREQLIPCCIH